MSKGYGRFDGKNGSAYGSFEDAENVSKPGHLHIERRHFNSTREFYTWVSREHQEHPTNINGDGFGNDARIVKQGLELLASGDETYINDAQQLLDKFHAEIDAPGSQWARSVVGYVPDVPSLLAGDPESMWIEEITYSVHAPLRVWVGVSSSGGISAEKLRKRGIALAAFALAMDRIRPVVISPYVEEGNGGYTEGSLISWDISTQPLVLSELMTIARSEVTRYVGLYATTTVNQHVIGRWLDHDSSSNTEKMRSYLGASQEDIVLTGIHLYDELLTNPEKWIKDKIQQYKNMEG